VTTQLRLFTDDDVEPLLAAFADPEIARWNPGPTDRSGALAFVAGRNDWSGGDHVSWAIDVDDRLGGSVSLHHLSPAQSHCEVGYWVAPWARRRGVATGALRLATSYAFSTLAMVRVFLYHSVDNPASCGVAGSAGFAYEGTLRQSYRYGGGDLHDEHLHARLVTD